MNINQKKEYIEQKIKEANPELMELGFGCYVKDRAGIARLDKDGWKLWGKPEQNLYCNKNDKGNTIVTEILEIIGKEIQLHHVLLAISKTRTIYLKSFGDYVRLSDDDAPVVYWDMYETYDNQKPEVYEFLYQIMNK